LREKERERMWEGEEHTTGKRERERLFGWVGERKRESEKEIKVHWQNTFIFYAFLRVVGIWQLKVHL
jgi:hypothetical protein